MQFDKIRTLKNNVFSTKIIRVEDDDQDCVLRERVLEDDFGYVEIQTGGKFEGIVTNDSIEGVVITASTDKKVSRAVEESETLAFSLPSNKVKIVMGAQIPFSCDANQEVSRTFFGVTIPAIKIAEAKCKIFEEVIEARIKAAVAVWKKKNTDFEREILEPIHIEL